MEKDTSKSLFFLFQNKKKERAVKVKRNPNTTYWLQFAFPYLLPTRKIEEKHPSVTIHYNLSDLQFLDLLLICVYLLSKHSVAEGKTCKRQLRTMLTWAQQLIESRLGYYELFTRILDEHHKPDMFAAGCLPTFSPPFLETNGLFISWQLTQCTSHTLPVLRETGTPNNFFCVHPKTRGFLLYSVNTITILKNKISFNLIWNSVANSLEEPHLKTTVPLQFLEAITCWQWENRNLLLDVIKVFAGKYPAATTTCHWDATAEILEMQRLCQVPLVIPSSTATIKVKAQTQISGRCGSKLL